VPPSRCYPRADYSLAVLFADWEAVARWWDGVELWLTQLWLPLQIAFLIVVLLPMCWWAALLLDRGVDLAADWVRRRAAGDPDDPP
jgi:hypothetical protein